MKKRKTWRWRVSDPSLNPGLNLLYEPGNWGDVLKGAWAIEAARAIARDVRPAEVRFADPYAGSPTYPLVPAARARLDLLARAELTRFQRPYVEKGLLASTALLVRDAARLEGARAVLSVFDLDPERLAAWKAEEGASVLPIASGEEIVDLLTGLEEAPHLILVDPYDLFDRFDRFLPAISAAAGSSTILFYCYDKAPRGPGQERVSLALHREMERAFAGGGGLLVGRLPADPGLARAYHEVFLAGPRRITAALRDVLADTTRSFARILADLGSFEEHGPTP